MERINAWNIYDLETQKACSSFAEDYRNFISDNKTERECVDAFVNEAEDHGYVELERAIQEKRTLKPGDKIYCAWMNKSLVLFEIGTEPMENGLNILGAHIDSPRLDIKQNPLFEKAGFGYLDTHYYGGIKKYQWTTIPLALHGLVVLRSGETVSIRIGEDPGDPQFTVGDLLPHLAADQAKKTMGDIVSAEQLNVFIGSRPFSQDEESDRVKLTILDLLHEKYGMVEEDFLSAELMAVPAVKAVDIGLDRSAIGAYGQDDRVCSYACLKALLDLEGTPARTAVCVLADKEEIGSVGNTGLNSDFLLHYVEDLAEMAGANVRKVLRNSICLSSDVGAAFDPTFADVYEKNNSCFLGRGVGLFKYTGARGKSGSNDASAELMAKVVGMMDQDRVHWQTGELGAVDMGGGGTVALFVAGKDVNVVDLGVPVLSMHSPFEITSKLDVYSAYCAYKAFYKN